MEMPWWMLEKHFEGRLRPTEDVQCSDSHLSGRGGKQRTHYMIAKIDARFITDEGDDT